MKEILYLESAGVGFTVVAYDNLGLQLKIEDYTNQTLVTMENMDVSSIIEVLADRMDCSFDGMNELLHSSFERCA